MSRHLNNGQLRAALDGELDQPASQHLESCDQCRLRLEPIRAQAEAVAQNLAFLRHVETVAMPSIQPSLDRFYKKKLEQKEMSMFKRLIGSRVVQSTALAALALAVILSVPATRALADQLLNLFRIQQVTVLPVDFTGLQSLNGNSALGTQISQLVSDSMTMLQKPGDPVAASSAADASSESRLQRPSSLQFSLLALERSRQRGL